VQHGGEPERRVRLEVQACRASGQPRRVAQEGDAGARRLRTGALVRQESDELRRGVTRRCQRVSKPLEAASPPSSIATKQPDASHQPSLKCKFTVERAVEAFNAHIQLQTRSGVAFLSRSS